MKPAKLALLTILLGCAPVFAKPPSDADPQASQPGRPKTAVPKTAWYAVVADPQGNIFGIWQADPLAFPPPEPD